MFKCLECGAEYSQKPDFCDCGNDTFEEIAEKVQPAQEYEKESEPKHKKTFEEQYPEISSFIGTLDPISVVIFGLCIFLSIMSLIFIKPKEQPITDVPKDKPPVERKVADIKSFWDDTPPKPEVVAVKKQEPTIASQITDMISKMSEPQPAKQTENPKTQSVQKPATQQKPKTSVKPSVQQPKKTQTTTKPAQTQTVKKQPASTQKTSTPPKTTTQTKPSTSSQQPKTSTATTTQQNRQTQATPPIAPKPVQPQPTVNTAAIQAQAAQELKTFKTGLRNTLFRKINFTRVYGDGACVVDFKVDSTGKIVNRSFSKQSNNNSLNDEVYQAIMSTPTYKTPPSSYRGQTLHFSVKFQGGQYEVSLY